MEDLQGKNESKTIPAMIQSIPQNSDISNEEKYKICINCNNAIAKGEKYCRFCGTKTGDGKFEPTRVTANYATIYGPPPAPSPEQKGTRRKKNAAKAEKGNFTDLIRRILKF